ncbi:hypothetical protein AAFX15_01585 [Vibrio chagasii]|uniref:GTP pyrophosphokinase n=1 Tax=Vibrio chagasii TaxID=170679 RepID=UPI0038CEDCB3
MNFLVRMLQVQLNGKNMNTKDFTDWYIQNRPIYKRLSDKVESILIEVFEANDLSYHMITSRAKDIESARKKAAEDKYKQPADIQDYAGIRVITYVEEEVEAVTRVIENLFDIDSENSSNKSEALGTDKVGYKSVHYIAKLKDDRLNLPEFRQYQDKYFEIQVRTILQHAWAEIEHDRNYKFSGKLDSGLTRRFKLLAGVLELADREFNAISSEIDAISTSVTHGNLNTELSSAALTSFIKSKFGDTIEKLGLHYEVDSRGLGIAELERFGINTIEELDELIPDDTEEYINLMAKETRGHFDEDTFHELGIARNAMIISDTDKYFSTCLLPENKWDAWNPIGEEGNRELTKAYLENKGVDFSHIEAKYDIPYYMPY